MASEIDEKVLRLLTSDEGRSVGPERNAMLRIILGERLALDTHEQVSRHFEFLAFEQDVAAAYLERVFANYDQEFFDRTNEILDALLKGRSQTVVVGGLALLTDMEVAARHAKVLIVRFDNVIDSYWDVAEFLRSVDDGLIEYEVFDNWGKLSDYRRDLESYESAKLQSLLQDLYDRDRYGRLRSALIEVMPALLSVAYRVTTDPVPERYYWLFTESRTRLAQILFYKGLRPAQTERVLRRAIRSASGEGYCEMAWSIPDALPHVLNLLCTADDLALLHLVNLEKFGPSFELLGHLIDITERILVQLGHLPFEFEDNRPQLRALARLAGTIFRVADQLDPSESATWIPRLRGLDAQFELRWPRVASNDSALTSRAETRWPVLQYQAHGLGQGHLADWIRAASLALGDAGGRNVFPRQMLARVEQAESRKWRQSLAGRGTSDVCRHCCGAWVLHCPTCGGTGRTKADSVIESMNRSWKKDPTTTYCYDCHATGRWICPSCGGSGEEPITRP